MAELVAGRLVRLLHALDPRDEEAPVLAEHLLEHLVLGAEIVVEETVRDAGLLGDVADAARMEPLAREDAHGRNEELPPFVLYRLRASRQRGRSLLGLLPVCHGRSRRGGEIRDRARDLPDHLLQLARDDPDLVRLALRDLRERLEVLVREQLGIRLALVDRREDGLDRLRLTLGPQDGSLLLALGREDRRLLLALRL